MTIKRRRRLEITVEREQVAVSTHAGGRVAGQCPQCGADVEMTSPEVAAKIFDVSARTIYRLIESGQVHFVEAPDRELQVCLRSVRAACGVLGEVERNQAKHQRLLP